MENILHILKQRMTNYEPIPFWSWNDDLKADELKRQIHWMYENGIGAFFMHARSGLKTPYLSDEWMRLTEECCKEAEALGMNAWAYDENGWPSGFAGGKLLEELTNHDMYISRSLGAWDPDADVSYFVTDTQLIRAEHGGNGEYLNLYLRYAASTVDILNPAVVRKFMDITHEQYKAHFGDDLAGKVKGFFTDEPQYYRWDTPYTPMIREWFQQEYGEDILDKLGLLFLEKEGYRTFRYRYWLGMQKLMIRSFGKQIYDWCSENGVELTGHYVEESSMGLQLMCCGGAMPFYEYEHIPGIDWLGNTSDNELSPKQLGSAAAQLGRKHTLSETFGCCGWDVTPADLRRIAGFQYVNGVNLMCHHLIPYSEHGQRKGDYPAHYNPINPWVKEHFKDFNDYFTRLGYLLAESTEPVKVAMLHPMRSCYFDYKRDLETDDFGVGELDAALRKACRSLSSRGIAYHFLDETLLERHGHVDDASIGCGLCSYQYLVIPKILTMGGHTRDLIRQYVAQGGFVLLLDDAPSYLEGEPYDYSWLQSNCTMADLENAQPYHISDTENELYYTYRLYEGRPFLYVQNASRNTTYTQTFFLGDRIHSFIALDPITLTTRSLPLTVTLPECGSLLLFPSEDPAAYTSPLPEYTLQFTKAAVSFEHNFLTLNQVRYSKDGRNYSEPLLRHKLFQQLLEERYEGSLWLKYDFTIETLPKRLTLLAEKGENLAFAVNGKPFAFSKSYEDEPALWLGDITSYIHEGLNSYEVELHWHQSDETYYALFGENVTESLKNCIVYDSEIEDVYLAGPFGVYSVEPFVNNDEETLLGRNFYIGAVPETITEPVTDGLPFFRGHLTLTQTVHLEDPHVMLRPLGRYQLAAVKVNGCDAGEAFLDRLVDISRYAKAGDNEIEVTFTIGNRNVMGPFHVASREASVGPDSFKCYDLDGWYKFYRFYKKW